MMNEKIVEWQVSENLGENILTSLTKKQAEKEFKNNLNATALIKLIWIVDSDDEILERNERIIKTKELKNDG